MNKEELADSLMHGVDEELEKGALMESQRNEFVITVEFELPQKKELLLPLVSAWIETLDQDGFKFINPAIDCDSIHSDNDGKDLSLRVFADNDSIDLEYDTDLQVAVSRDLKGILSSLSAKTVSVYGN